MAKKSNTNPVKVGRPSTGRKKKTYFLKPEIIEHIDKNGGSEFIESLIIKSIPKGVTNV